MPARVYLLVNAVAKSHGYTAEDLLTRSRVQPIAWARFHAWLAIRTELRGPFGAPFSLPQIGRWFGYDHTSVLHGVRRAEQMHLPFVPPPVVRSAPPFASALWGWGV
jgi:chromosomal replication initiation ATPase DnaA